MAAPKVDSHACTLRLRGKKGNKTYFPVKNTITSPFLTEWPQLSNEDSTLVLKKIKSTFTPHAESLAKQPSKGRKKVAPDEAKKKRAVLRSQLALGVNEVTRSLEQGRLRLALVCRSAKPALMTNHLMSLSATRNTPVLCLHGLSASLAPILKLQVILAIGFKKTTTDDPAAFDELVNSIIAVTPPIRVPWLEYKELTLDELRKVVTNVVLGVKARNKSAAKQKGKNKGKSKGRGSSGVQAPDQAQAGTPSGSDGKASKNPDSGANAEAPEAQRLQALKREVAPEHEQNLDAGNQSKSTDNFEQSLHSSEQSLHSSAVKSDPQDQSTSSVTETTSGQSTDQVSVISKKRRLSGTNDPTGPSKKKTKMFLKPDYKPVTVLPVKIIPKDLKDKKQLKKKRKKNKRKSK